MTILGEGGSCKNCSEGDCFTEFFHGVLLVDVSKSRLRLVRIELTGFKQCLSSFCSLFSAFFQAPTIGLVRIRMLAVSVLSVSVPAAALVHKDMHQWAQQDNQKGEIRKNVGAVLHKEKVECGANQCECCQAVKAGPVSGFACH
jgi:hypothetical protein